MCNKAKRKKKKKYITLVMTLYERHTWSIAQGQHIHLITYFPLKSNDFDNGKYSLYAIQNSTSAREAAQLLVVLSHVCFPKVKCVIFRSSEDGAARSSWLYLRWQRLLLFLPVMCLPLNYSGQRTQTWVHCGLFEDRSETRRQARERDRRKRFKWR